MKCLVLIGVRLEDVSALRSTADERVSAKISERVVWLSLGTKGSALLGSGCDMVRRYRKARL